MRLARIILGLLVVALAFWPAMMCTSFGEILLSGHQGGPNVHVYQVVSFASFGFTGWQIYAAAILLGLVALGMVCSGIFLICARTRDEA
jgi:hypothetical protein